eukprot:GFUD01071657.1.p1 GENE.GFUD01071657.1~~GFUD01071657.1.p1  ORF type:complete len:342 (-),score=90.72 GFUD01071657.1:111-1082(-)
MAYLPFFLLLCAFPISSTSPTLAESSTYTDTNTPTLSEAVRIIQVNAIQELNQNIVEQETLIKNKELKNVIETQKTELNTIPVLKNEISNQKMMIDKMKEEAKEKEKKISGLETKSKDIGVLVKFMRTVLNQNIIKAQTNGIRQVTNLENFIKMTGLPFNQDDAGNIIPIAGHPQCMMDYTTWTEDWRMVRYSTQPQAANHCDQAPASSINTGFTSGWHRFVFNGVDARIPTHAPASQYYQGYGQTCGTYGASWMDGSLPSLGEPPKDVTIKFSGGGQAEYSTKFRKPAKVVACLDENYQTFYLYHLVQVYQCNLAYCATTEF